MLLGQMFEELRPLVDSGNAVEISSSPGVGKSESGKQWAKKQSEIDGFEWGVCTLFLATQTPVDLLGYLIPGTKEWKNALTGATTTTRVSEFTRPIWTLSDDGIPLENFQRSVLFLEEADKCETDVTKTSAEIRLNASLGPWRFDRKKLARVAFTNRAIDRSGSGKKFDYIINRQFEFQVLADLEGWRDNYALPHGVDPLFVAFACKYPEVVFANKVPEVQGPYCTPRSFCNLADVLPRRVTADGQMKVDSVTSEIITGAIGQAAGMQLMAWIKLRHETPDWEDIIKDPKGIAIPVKPDAQLMTCYECAHRVDVKTAGKAVDYIKRLPAQFSVTFAKAAVKRNYDLINTPSFLDWVSKNASLLNAIGGTK